MPKLNRQPRWSTVSGQTVRTGGWDGGWVTAAHDSTTTTKLWT